MRIFSAGLSKFTQITMEGEVIGKLGKFHELANIVLEPVWST
jgi:hypothetical protein